MAKRKRTKSDLQNITLWDKPWATRIPQKTGVTLCAQVLLHSWHSFDTLVKYLVLMATFGFWFLVSSNPFWWQS